MHTAVHDLTDAARRANPGAGDALVADAGVDRLESLLAGLWPGTELRLVAPSQNPWPVLLEVLSRPQLERLHVLGHGKAGQVSLGRLALRLGWLRNLPPIQRADSLQAVCFWSCLTGAGATGQRFLQGVADLTGSTVFAASTPVGATELGGRWHLDVRVEPSRSLRATHC